jgi:hypothetical protein
MKASSIAEIPKALVIQDVRLLRLVNVSVFDNLWTYGLSVVFELAAA